MAGLAPWRSRNKVFVINARRPEGRAGVTGRGSVLFHFFVGLIKFSGMAASPSNKCRRDACGTAVVAGGCFAYGVSGNVPGASAAGGSCAGVY